MTQQSSANYVEDIMGDRFEVTITVQVKSLIPNPNDRTIRREKKESTTVLEDLLRQYHESIRNTIR